jgi:hypothetical protein
VLSGKVRIGWIHKGAMLLAADRVAFWNCGFALHVSPCGLQMHGAAATLERGQGNDGKNCRAWLTAMLLLNPLLGKFALSPIQVLGCIRELSLF